MTACRLPGVAGGSRQAPQPAILRDIEIPAQREPDGARIDAAVQRFLRGEALEFSQHMAAQETAGALGEFLVDEASEFAEAHLGSLPRVARPGRCQTRQVL